MTLEDVREAVREVFRDPELVWPDPPVGNRQQALQDAEAFVLAAIDRLAREDR